MNRAKSLAAASLAVLLLAACGSTGGDVFGGGSGKRYEVRGTVDYVDLNSRSLTLRNASGTSSMLSSGGGSTVRVYFDNQTEVVYQGRTFRPEDLEPGDQVAIQVDDNGNRLLADSVTVTYNARASSTYPGSSTPSGSYTTTLRGTVRYVDTSRGTIELDRGFGSATIVEYDSSMPVYFNNRTYRATDLERGDEIDIRVRDLGNGRYLASDVTVLRSVGSSSAGTSTYGATIRGTVRYVDTASRTIQLDSATWLSGFTTGSTVGRTVIVQYDSNSRVDYQGQLHPVTNLERGDLVDVQVSNSTASTPFAQRITLVRDVRQ